MKGLLVISAVSGTLIVDNRVNPFEDTSALPSNGLQLASLLFATYQAAMSFSADSQGGASKLHHIRMGDTQFALGRAKCSVDDSGDVIVVVLLDHRMSRPAAEIVCKDLNEVVTSLAAEKSRQVLQKQLHSQLCSYSEHTLNNMARSLSSTVPYFRHRRVLLVAHRRREPTADKTHNDSDETVAFGDLDFQLGIIRRGKSARDMVPIRLSLRGAPRQGSRRNRKNQAGFFASLLSACSGLCAPSKPSSGKKSSVHPLPSSAAEESRSMLHASEALGRYYVCGGGSVGAEAGGASTGSSEATASENADLARGVLTAVAEYQSVTSDDVEPLRRYRYDANTKRLLPPRRATGHGTAGSLEVRAAAGVVGSAAPSQSKKRVTLVERIASGLSGKRGTLVAAPVKVQSATSYEALYVPELELVVLCSVVEGGGSLPSTVASPELNEDSAALWDFLVMAACCVGQRLVPGVQEVTASD